MTNVFAVNIQATRINKPCGTQVDRIAMGDVCPLLATDGLCGRNEANYTSGLPMTSFRQIAAKQRNPSKSTGPTTEEGKQRSRCPPRAYSGDSDWGSSKIRGLLDAVTMSVRAGARLKPRIPRNSTPSLLWHPRYQRATKHCLRQRRRRQYRRCPPRLLHK